MTALEDSSAIPTVAIGGSSGVPGAGGLVASPPYTSGPPSGASSVSIGAIVGGVVGGLSGIGALAVVVFLWMRKRSNGGQGQHYGPGPAGLPDDGLSNFVCFLQWNAPN